MSIFLSLIKNDAYLANSYQEKCCCIQLANICVSALVGKERLSDQYLAILVLFLFFNFINRGAANFFNPIELIFSPLDAALSTESRYVKIFGIGPILGEILRKNHFDHQSQFTFSVVKNRKIFSFRLSLYSTPSTQLGPQNLNMSKFLESDQYWGRYGEKTTSITKVSSRLTWSKIEQNFPSH